MNQNDIDSLGATLALAANAEAKLESSEPVGYYATQKRRD